MSTALTNARKKWLRAQIKEAKKAASRPNATEKAHASALSDWRRYEAALARLGTAPVKKKKKKGGKRKRSS